MKKIKNPILFDWNNLSKEDLEVILPKQNYIEKPITYTEEEVYELFNSFRKDFPLHRGIQIMDYDLKEWFNNNKKK